MFRIFINQKAVNQFASEEEAYEFACAIEANETLEEFDSEKDEVTFEYRNGVTTTKNY